MEITTSTALVSCDVLGGYDWSDQKPKLMVLGEITIRELRKKLETVQKEKDGIQLNVDKFEHAYESLNKLKECQIVDNCKKVGKSDDSSIIEDWMSDSEEENVSQPKTKKKTIKPSIVKIEFVKPKQQEKTTRKTVKQTKKHRHMTGNISYLTDYEEIDWRDMFALWRNPKGGKSQEKLIDESQVLLRVPRKDNMYSVNLKNIVPKGGLTCLFAKATYDESKLWHRRLGKAAQSLLTLIEAAKTMLADSKLLTTFWEEAVNTACYVQNRVLVVKPHNKTPYELFLGRTPTLRFYETIWVSVTILNTHRSLCKFDVRLNEGTQSNSFAGTKASYNAGQVRKETRPVKDYILLPLWTADPPFSQDLKSSHNDGSKPSSDDGKKVDEDLRKDSKSNDQEKEDNVNSTNNVNVANINEVNAVDDGVVADMNNLDTTIQVSPIPTTRIHKDHHLDQVIGDLQSATQTRNMSKKLKEHGRNQKGNSCIKGSKLDRGYAGRASTIQATRSLDFSGYTKWKKGFSQDKYVGEILKKFGFTKVKTSSTPMETQKPLLKDEDGEEVDVYMYRSMISSLMYLTSSRPDIMFAVCACARYQVNTKVSHLYAVKRIFRYLKGQPKLGLWYPKDSPFDLVAYTDSDCWIPY
ncbi:putative ribonuclease H-like domain-containing protein [Tanacetum coccineum]